MIFVLLIYMVFYVYQVVLLLMLLAAPLLAARWARRALRRRGLSSAHWPVLTGALTAALILTLLWTPGAIDARRALEAYHEPREASPMVKRHVPAGELSLELRNASSAEGRVDTTLDPKQLLEQFDGLRYVEVMHHDNADGPTIARHSRYRPPVLEPVPPDDPTTPRNEAPAVRTANDQRENEAHAATMTWVDRLDSRFILSESRERSHVGSRYTTWRWTVQLVERQSGQSIGTFRYACVDVRPATVDTMGLPQPPLRLVLARLFPAEKRLPVSVVRCHTRVTSEDLMRGGLAEFLRRILL